MGTILKDPKYLKLNVDIGEMIIVATKELLGKFMNVFVLNYKEFKGIPLHIVEHKIEPEIIILPSHHACYHMNLNYAIVVK